MSADYITLLYQYLYPDSDNYNVIMSENNLFIFSEFTLK